MSFVIVRDDREKRGFDFSAYPNEVEIQRLETGDYTIQKYEDVFAVERKSIPDLVYTTTWGRERFEAELKRAQELAKFCVVIEGYPPDVESYINSSGRKVHQNAIYVSVESWESYNHIDFLWCGSHSNAEYQTYHKLQKWYGEAVLNFF